MTAPLRGAALRSHGRVEQTALDRAGWSACLRLRGVLALLGVRLPIGSRTAPAVAEAVTAKLDRLARLERENAYLRAELARLTQEPRP